MIEITLFIWAFKLAVLVAMVVLGFYFGCRCGARSLLRQVFGPPWTEEEAKAITKASLQHGNPMSPVCWHYAPDGTGIDSPRWRQIVGRYQFDQWREEAGRG